VRKSGHKKITVLSWCTWLCFASWEHQCARGGNSTHNPRGPPRPHRTDPAAATRTATGRWRARSTVARTHPERPNRRLTHPRHACLCPQSISNLLLVGPRSILLSNYDPHPLSQVIFRNISYACMQASPDLAYGARVQFIGRLEENRRNIQGLGCAFRIMNE